MVTRKPVPGAGPAPSSNPPYPETPSSSTQTTQFGMQNVHSQMAPSNTDSESTSASAWGEEDSQHERNRTQVGVPESLRVGPPGYTPRTSQEGLRQTNNPFLQRQQTGASNEGNRDSSASVWDDLPTEPSTAPPPPPVPGMCRRGHLEVPILTVTAPTQQLSNLSVSESSTNPWQPALDQHTPQPIPQLQRESSGNEAWSEAPIKQPDSSTTSQTSQHPVLISVPSEPESPAWDEDDPSPPIHELPSSTGQESLQIEEDRNAWDDNTSRSQPAAVISQTPPQESWSMVNHESTGAQQSGVVSRDGDVLERYATSESEHPPALPPRRSEEQPPEQPPRPALVNHQTSMSSVTSPATRAQKKETYEVKKITWHDVTATQNPRISPILVQNANGPCPLLALVNALTLSTPANVETALVETLRSREQVSLGLLLDAVFDELMSGRRGDAAQELPDVGDLYSFLVTLHTGMNVNPRFVPVAKSSSELRSSMSHLHPSERQQAIPGTFEETREMRLYSTFNIPLIHGWLPDQDSPARLALSRSAKSYEDAQNLMFHEEGLEEKLQRDGLSFEEQGTLEDIATIKAFFASNATQLTPFGLQTITTSLAPGSVAILFRNDHFSTLYRHPETLQLHQLVTDLGYAGHEEVVWESLIDVNGENAEFFSGDFRVVGGLAASPSASLSNRTSRPSNEGWTTVPGRGRPEQLTTQSTSPTQHEPPPQSPNTEQEDHDLALALQMQEEEEERHRSEIERRRRETELSQQFIEQQANNVPVRQQGGRPLGESRPNIPPRRTGTNRPVDHEAGGDAPPPSYEQAANSAAYVPPNEYQGQNNVRGGRRMSGFASAGSALGRGGRRTSGATAANLGRVPTQQGQANEERSKDCVVM